MGHRFWEGRLDLSWFWAEYHYKCSSTFLFSRMHTAVTVSGISTMGQHMDIHTKQPLSRLTVRQSLVNREPVERVLSGKKPALLGRIHEDVLLYNGS